MVHRQLEHWLHQHIFKVGWLLTHNFQTTTILYYTFFLPGVVLHEVIYWLIAGVFDVRAQGSIKWPEKQEIGELKLNFVQLDRKAGVLKRAFISTAPTLAGLFVIWHIATNIFDIDAVFNTMQSGAISDVQAGLGQLINAPLFWLWIYIAFTVSNTMYPAFPKDLQGWRVIVSTIVIVSLALLLIGAGSVIFVNLAPSLIGIINALNSIFILMIVINLGVTAFLGMIEWVIERISGHSATFRKGKMITMTREEAIESQRREKERNRKRETSRRNPAADSALKSVYALPFPIPGSPGQEAVTQANTTILGIDDTSDDQVSLPGFQTERISTDLITAIGRPASPDILPEAPATKSPVMNEVPVAWEPTDSEEAVEEFVETREEDETEFYDDALDPEDAESDDAGQIFEEEKFLDRTPAPFTFERSPSSIIREDESDEALVEDISADEEIPDDIDTNAEEDDIEEPDDKDLSDDSDLEAISPFGKSILGTGLSRFGQKRPFTSSSDDDEDENEPSEHDLSRISPFAARPALSPFSSSLSKSTASNSMDEQDDLEEDETVLSRRNTGDDAVSDLFTSLGTSLGSDDSDDEADQSSSPWRRPATSTPSTLNFGRSRPAPKPVSNESDDEENDFSDDDDDIDYYDDDDDIDYDPDDD